MIICNITVNRKAAEALTRLGQFDQAISCWRRVEQAKPGDEEASKAISKLSVERTIQKGGYNEEILKGATDSKELEEAMRERVAQNRPEAIAAAAAAKSKGESEQEKGLLENKRGMITILDRAGLEKLSCECYRKVKDEFDRLLG